MHNLFNWLKRLFLGIFYSFILLFCGLFAYILFVGFIGEPLAKSVAPPQYPNWELVGRWRSGGPTIMWDRRSYRTIDDVLTVLTFYERHMPGFKLYEETLPSDQTKTGYFNGQCNESHLSNYLAETLEGSMPCASINVSPDPDNPSGTLILYWLSWSAP